MSRLQEKIRRLGEMGWPEVRFRVAQRMRLARERRSLGRNGASPQATWQQQWDPTLEAVTDVALRERLATAFAGDHSTAFLAQYLAARATPRFFFDWHEREALVAAHRSAFPARAAELRAEADAICEHRFHIFAYPEVSAGAEIPWRRDLVHGVESGLEHWSRIPYLDFRRAGDSKIVWEPNRHQHLVTLAVAHLVTGDERYAEECLAQIEHWQRNNTYPRGINWASSLEVAFRAWSWLWVLHLLAGSRALTGERAGRITVGLGEHAQYIAENLSTYFSPNTHLLGEGFALFCIGLLLPEFAGAKEWRETGRAILASEIEKQVRPDGMHIEQSSYYHRYAFDFFFAAAVLAERNGCSFPASYGERLARMADAILHTLLPSGRHPMTGDADGGRLLPFGARTADDQRGALSNAAVYFRRGDFRWASDHLHEETLWLLGPDAVQAYGQLPATPPASGSRVFRDAGLAVMRTGWNRKAHVLLFDAGPQGMSSCAHGHADALQVMVSADGEEWLVDPGTFVYTSAPQWRHAFAGTAAHNTVMVDGRDQAEAVDVFKWREPAQAKLERWISLPGADLAIGSHSGYARLAKPVVHRRTVVFLKPDYWILSDEFAGEGAHQFDFHLHFAPGVKLEATHNIWLAAKNGSRMLVAPPQASMAARVIQGDENTRQGWYSADYGHREPAPVLVGTAQAKAPARFHWLLWPMPATWPRVRELPGPGLRLAIETDAWCDLVAVRGQQIGFDGGELCTDAELAFVRREHSGVIARIALAGGCCVEAGAQPLVRAEGLLDEFEFTREASHAEIHVQPERRLRVHAPGVVTARVNGVETAFMHEGDWIEFRE